MKSMGAILASPLVVDNVICFGSTDGKLYAVN
jgi:outer membrane protein assembly factor BamB